MSVLDMNALLIVVGLFIVRMAVPIVLIAAVGTFLKLVMPSYNER
jgi:hypothetical protein